MGHDEPPESDRAAREQQQDANLERLKQEVAILQGQCYACLEALKEIWILSFSIFAFIFESWSICSCISATAS